MRLIWLLMIPVLVIGLAACGGGSTETAPAETVTVTETAEAVEVENSTPQACLDALDYADEGFGYAEDAMSVVVDMFDHITALDTAGLEKDTAALEDIRRDMQVIVDPYDEAKALCRS